MDEKSYMEQAIRKAREGVDGGQSPFGAVIVKDGKIVSASHNTVWRTTDPTAHAEVNAIRQASTALGNIDLSGTVMYTTCEPCPMCLTAIHWAKIERVVFGATIADADTAGFTELTIPAKEMVRLGGSSLKVESGLLQKECAELFQYWKSKGGRSY
jgi:guanine deaminase